MTHRNQISRRRFMQFIGLTGIAGALASCTNIQASPDTLFVSPKGNDAWSGAYPDPNLINTDGPLATIARARDIIRQRIASKQTVPGKVLLRGGRYLLDAPLEFSVLDSTPVTYAAYPGETPIIDGGRRIASSSWKQTTLTGREVWYADIPDVAAGKTYFRQLWVHGERRPRARMPKVGPAPEQRNFYNTNSPSSGQDYFSATNSIQLRNKVIEPTWQNLQDVELVLLHFWIEDRLPVDTFDADTNTVTSSRRSAMTVRKGTPFYIENALEMMSESGEWYLDRQAGRLWYLPKPDEKIAEIEAYYPVISQLLRVSGDIEKNQFVQGLRFEGISFEHTDWSQSEDGMGAWSVQAASTAPGIIVLKGTRDCAIHNCKVQHGGFYGVELAEGCTGIEISHNEISDLGAGGIKQNGANAAEDPKAAALTGRNTITDNHIHHCGRVFHSGVGVLSQNSFENNISHNHIHDLFYTGISCGWVWGYGPSVSRKNTIEKNHIHDLGAGWLGDLGGIYTLSMQPGTILRGNLIHHVEYAGYGGWGIYLDEGSSTVLVENNICYDLSSQPFHQHYGRNNQIRNNIFAFGREGQARLSKPEGADLAFTFEHNVVLSRNLPMYVGSSLQASISGNIKTNHNLFWDYSGKPPKFGWVGQDTLANWQTTGNDLNSLVADPGIVDIDKGDFRLSQNTPALQVGFTPIDMSDVGPRPL